MSMKVEAYIKSDLLRYKKKYTSINVIKEFIRNKGFRYSYLMRCYKGYKNDNKKLGAKWIKIIHKLLCINSTIEIPLGLEVGKGLYLGHFYGITINPNAVLGNNINIHKGVTIGQENRGKRKGNPTIGNKVWLGINSTIVGNIVVGDNVLIAPNSFVNFDVPADSVVIGNEIKECVNATEGYINNMIV